MINKIKISENVYYVGTNDRKKQLFENNWPLPYGVSYNSYLIKDTYNVLIDTIELGSNDKYLETIDQILEGADLHYLIVNHMEPDHSGSIGLILSKYPRIKIIGNKKTKDILSLYFNIKPDNFKQIEDGEVLNTGKSELQFALIPWVHWPETMVTLEIKQHILFSCDAFGGFGALNGGIFDDENDFERYYLDDMRRYYSNIVGKYSGMVQKAIAKLGSAKIKIIAPSHGLVWRKDPSKVLNLYNKWSSYGSDKGVVIAYASMYGNTEKIADAIGRAIGERGIKNVRIFDVSTTNVSFILSEIWEYKGLILGTCAYNTQMHPMMEHLCNEIRLSAPKEKICGIFGSSTWNGAGVKCLKKFFTETSMTIIEPSVETMGAVTDCKIEDSINKFADNFCSKL